VWFKRLKFVGVSGWGQKCRLLARPSYTKFNMAYKRMFEVVTPSKHKTANTRAFSQNVSPGLVTKELTHSLGCVQRSTHSIAIVAMLDLLVISIFDRNEVATI